MRRKWYSQAIYLTDTMEDIDPSQCDKCIFSDDLPSEFVFGRNCSLFIKYLTCPLGQKRTGLEEPGCQWLSKYKEEGLHYSGNM